MIYFLLAILVLSILMLLFWLFQLMVGLDPAQLERELDQTVSSDQVERMLEQLDERGQEPLSRQEIRERMRWIWKETRIFALGSRSFLASLYLLVFAALWGLVWLKTLLKPNAEDLRLLLGGELFMLVQVRHRDDE